MIVSFKKRAPRDPIRREVDNLTRAHFRLADYSRVALERLSYLGRLEILLKIGRFLFLMYPPLLIGFQTLKINRVKFWCSVSTCFKDLRIEIILILCKNYRRKNQSYPNNRLFPTILQHELFLIYPDRPTAD